MSQKLPVNKFEGMEDTFQFNEDFIKMMKKAMKDNEHNEKGNEVYFLEVDVQYLEKLHKLYNDLPFLPKRIEIEKVENLVTNLHGQTEYVILIRNLNQALNHRFLLKKVHRMIKFNQKV